MKPGRMSDPFGIPTGEPDGFAYGQVSPGGGEPDYPTPDELLAAHRTMRKMTRAAMAEATGPNDMPNPGAFLSGAWGEWVEATRQIALACSWMGDDEGGIYAVAWEQMMDDEERSG